jgi:hypothetical protein
MIRVSKMVQQYAGRTVLVGEGFEVEEAHVALLLHLGRIDPEKGEPGYVERPINAKKKRLG